MIDLMFPSSTRVGKPIPKNAFYKHLAVNTKIKQHFVDDIVGINWLYKFAPSTLNVTDGTEVHEIVIFSAELKSKECPDDVFLFIDRNMPRHAIFILKYEGLCKILINYKEWNTPTTFEIVKTFSTEWMTPDKLTLTLEGQTMDAIYEVMAGQISGYGTTTKGDTRRLIELEALITKAQKDVDALQRKIRSERQLNRQMEMNVEARKLKQQIALWQTELQELKQ